jgi:hypothetical protein
MRVTHRRGTQEDLDRLPTLLISFGERRGGSTEIENYEPPEEGWTVHLGPLQPPESRNPSVEPSEESLGAERQHNAGTAESEKSHARPPEASRPEEAE